jgi:hypothetical protein
MSEQTKKSARPRLWHVNGHVSGGKYLGQVEAATAEEAEEKAWKLADVSFCHQCASECENATIESVNVEPDDE